MAELVLEDAALIQLSQQADLRQAFPFLQQIQSIDLAKCARCAKNRATRVLDAVKTQIAGLPEDRRQQFKTLAGADTVRLFYKARRQGVQELVF